MRSRKIGMESLLTLGRQHFAVHPQEVAADPRLAAIVEKAPQLHAGEDAFAEPFFRAVGIQTIDSLDASDYESCSRVHDLNVPVPSAWHGQYDVVFDGGTLEHVFHFPNAIANAMNLVKQGGMLVTQSPSNNLNGHGFYQFSPELMFRVFCEANGFRILLMALAESDGKRRMFRVQDPDRIGRRITFGGDSGLQMVMVARRERMVSPLGQSPYQSDYTATWNDNETSAMDQNARTGQTAPPSLKHRIRGVLPSRWTYHYDRMRATKNYRSGKMDGVTQVKSIHDCWLPQSDIKIPATPQANPTS